MHVSSSKDLKMKDMIFCWLWWFSCLSGSHHRWKIRRGTPNWTSFPRIQSVRPSGHQLILNRRSQASILPSPDPGSGERMMGWGVGGGEVVTMSDIRRNDRRRSDIRFLREPIGNISKIFGRKNLAKHAAWLRYSVLSGPVKWSTLYRAIRKRIACDRSLWYVGTEYALYNEALL